MPPRSSWKGFINLSLVSVAVKAYSASGDGSKIRLNQLHGECNSRIQYAKRCPQCGDVPNDEIVKGYEYAKDQYAVIDENELEKLRAENSQRTIAVDTFIKPEVLDPIYYSDSKYYLTPDGPAGQKAFSLLHDSMEQMGLYCVAKVVLHNKEQLVLIRPFENLLCMTVLKYSAQVKSPAAFDDEIVETKVTKAERSLAKMLIEQTTSTKFDLASYSDDYTENLTQLIEAKVNGSELVSPPAVEAPANVINLMDALKASVSRAEAATKKTAALKKAPAGKTGQRKTASTKKSTKVLAAELSKGSRKKSTKRKKQSAG